MKKFFSIVLAILLSLACFSLVGCEDRSTILKIYGPGEYIAPEVLEEFEEWYYEKTGENVTVKFKPFDAVEEIFSAVELAHADYDLLLPSDYAVEYLINNDLLVKVDKNIVNVEACILPEYIERARISDPNLEYSVPYMYGTFGLMYNYKLTGKHIDSWSALFTDEYNQLFANKDSMREALSSAAIWANREELSELSGGFTNYGTEYQNKLQSIYEDTSETAINAAISELNKMRAFQKLWGGENLKYEMATESSNIQVALMWSCDAGYIMNDFEDDDGVEHEGNRNMWYVVPKEGGNIYLDNLVISKYSANQKAAQYFLQFVCTKEIAKENSDYAGAISPVKAAYEELYAEYTEDLEEDPASQEWKDMYMDMLFPSTETLNRCGTMRDYGKTRNDEISSSWADVRHQ